MIPDGRKRLCHIDVQAVLALKQVKSAVKDLFADDGYDVVRLSMSHVESEHD
jgi:hypothetical protein